VTRITHEADLQKNTLQIKVQVLDPSPLLKPEMLTRVRFLGSQAGSEPASAQAARVRVPESCVQAGRVWVVRHRNGTRGEAQSAAVQVVDRGEDGLVTVEGPLHVGDLLVRQPAGLQSGQPVRIQNETGGDA
jgi:ribosomal protein S28E/S33